MKTSKKHLIWTVEYTPEVQKLLRKLDKSVTREILTYLEEVATLEDVRVKGKGLTANLSGLWRYRIRDMRVICRIQDEKLLVLVVHVGKREIVYDI